MTGAGGSDEEKGPDGGSVPFKVDHAAAREMAACAGRYVRRARDAGVNLNFSDASIEPADRFAFEVWTMLPGGLRKDAAEEIRSRLVLELGAYFGETFIRNYGGVWGWATIGGRRLFALRTRSGFNVFPMHQVTKRLRGVEKDPLVGLYGSLSRWRPATREPIAPSWR